eukprot:jgi/Botrbrau1/12828/Bobra.20_1s0018.1
MSDRPLRTRARRSTPKQQPEPIPDEALELLTEEEREIALRRAKNREAARKSRERRLQKIERLQSDVASLEHKNTLLINAVKEASERAAEFEARNTFIKTQLEKLRACAFHGGGRAIIDHILEGSTATFSAPATTKSATSESSAEPQAKKVSLKVEVRRHRSMDCFPLKVCEHAEQDQNVDTPSSRRTLQIQNGQQAQWKSDLQSVPILKPHAPLVTSATSAGGNGCLDLERWGPSPHALMKAASSAGAPGAHQSIGLPAEAWDIPAIRPSSDAQGHMPAGNEPFAQSTALPSIPWKTELGAAFDTFVGKGYCIEGLEHHLAEHYGQLDSGGRLYAAMQTQPIREGLPRPWGILPSPGNLDALFPAGPSSQSELMGKPTTGFMDF